MLATGFSAGGSGFFLGCGGRGLDETGSETCIGEDDDDDGEVVVLVLTAETGELTRGAEITRGGLAEGVGATGAGLRTANGLLTLTGVLGAFVVATRGEDDDGVEAARGLSRGCGAGFDNGTS